MTVIEKIRSNAEVHGMKFALNWCVKNKINIDIALAALIGKYHGCAPLKQEQK